MSEGYDTSPRAATHGAVKVRDGGTANTIYGAKPQEGIPDDNQKKGEGLHWKAALFGFRVGVDKYGWRGREGEVPDDLRA